MVAQDLPQRCGLGPDRWLVAMASRLGHHTRAFDYEAVTGQEVLDVEGAKSGLTNCRQLGVDELGVKPRPPLGGQDRIAGKEGAGGCMEETC